MQPLSSAVSCGNTNSPSASPVIVVRIYLHTCACAAYSSRDYYLMVASIQRNMVHHFSWHCPSLSQSFTCALTYGMIMRCIDTLKLVSICVLLKAETQYILKSVYVAIPGRNRTLFHCIFRPCRTCIKGEAHKHYEDLSGIHASSLCVWAPPLMEVLRYKNVNYKNAYGPYMHIFINFCGSFQTQKNNKIPSPPSPPTKNIICCSYKACVTPPLTKVQWYWNVYNKFWPGCHHCLKFKCTKLCSFYSHLLSHPHTLTFSTLTLTSSHSTLTLTSSHSYLTPSHSWHSVSFSGLQEGSRSIHSWFPLHWYSAVAKK